MSVHKQDEVAPEWKPGQVMTGDGEIEIDLGELVEVEVVNTGDRPIQVGSHYHFAECNQVLSFDRVAAYGKRLAIPSGTSIRFEPGIEVIVRLASLRGRMVVAGLNGKVAGSLFP